MRILLTASGAQGSYELINNFHSYDWYVHGVDVNPRVIGRFIADKFTQVPPANNPGYIKKLIEIVHTDGIDVIYPQSDLDVLPLALNIDQFPCKVVLSSLDSLMIATNKAKVYDTLKDTGLLPEYAIANTPRSFHEGALKLGYGSGKSIVCRLPKSKGGRGMFLLSNHGNDVINNRNPPPVYNLKDGLKYFSDSGEIYLMTEFVFGEEIDSMAICQDGEVYLTTHKTRLKTLSGTIAEGEMVDRPELDIKIQAILERIPLSYNISLQFKGGKLLEINPRSSTYVYAGEFSEPYMGLMLATGGMTYEDIFNYKPLIPYGRKFIRYMTQYFW